jgi:MerR family mercuric resistance operon transcriptional regulator
MRGMTIGQLAKAAGVGVETIRYYQRRELIAVPPRPLGSARRYAHDVIAQLAFIRRAQDLGFTLDEIALLMQVPLTSCSMGRGFARAKHEELGERIRELNEMRAQLQACIVACDGTSTGDPCPFISKLIGEPA